ncbi:MAG: M20/M25/M40 family metallo-hydrolase, partial [Verrucomicrobiota bacterium]
MSSTIPPSLVEEGVDLLQALIRCDTSNPPGNEAKAVSILEQLLHEDGIPFERIEPERGRANLIARLPGDGTEEPLLLSSHLDVVPASEEGWTHPPFSGVNADGYIWGRGAIDMKGFAAMAFTLFRQAKREHRRRKRDLIFAAVADEERGCQWGSSYLVEHHPDLVTAEYAINEVGGFSIDVRGQPFFLIQRAERGVAWIRVRFRGKPGHSSLPTPHSALQQAAKAITQLSGAKLPHHPNAPALDFLDAVGAASSPIERMVLRSLHSPALGKWVLHHLFPPGEQRLNTQASLSNSMTPTVIHAGNAVNVVPSEVTMDIDGRIVPGSSLDELLHELRTIIGPDPQVEILAHHPPSVFPT